MKLKARKFLSVLLCMIMVLGTVNFPALAEMQPRTLSGAESTVEVMVSVQKDGAFITPPHEITVTDGIAEEYGFAVPETDHTGEKIDSPTFLDAMVALHKEIYGEAFTAETAGEYLELGSYGYLGKAFGADSSASGFYINSKMPADQNGMGYTAATARLENGDSVEFWFYQDTSTWSDCYTTFDNVTANAVAGEEITLTMYKETFDENYVSTLVPIDGTDVENNYITINEVLPDGSIGAALTDGETEITPDAEGKVTFSFENVGTYVITAQGFVNGYAPIVAPYCIVTVTKGEEIPQVNISHNTEATLDGVILVKPDEEIQLFAHADDESMPDVTWSMEPSELCTIEENTGKITVLNAVFGDSETLEVSAIFADDGTTAAKASLNIAGYAFDAQNKTQTVVLPDDGKSKATFTVSGGYGEAAAWSFSADGNQAEAIGELSGTQVRFTALRPGKVSVSFEITTDSGKKLSDTAGINIKGVSVEDENGNFGKISLTATKDNPNPSAKLTANLEEGRKVSRWESEKESVATVSEDGTVTAESTGSTVIFAVDDAGNKGGITVEVRDGSKPYIEKLELDTSSLAEGSWENGKTFDPEKLSYDITLKNYGTDSLTILDSVSFDSEKYSVSAEYTGIENETRVVSVENGKKAVLDGIPFGTSAIVLKVTDKEDEDNLTAYTFNVTRPRDTENSVKESGIALTVERGELSPVKYNGALEGQMLHADESGNVSGTSGVTASQMSYRTFVYDNAVSFNLNIIPKSAYAHVRYSTDNGATYKETGVGAGKTDNIPVYKDEWEITSVIIEIVDDKTYSDNLAAGRGGFDGETKKIYRVAVDKIPYEDMSIKSLSVSDGDIYPEFSPERTEYNIITANGSELPSLYFTAGENAVVKRGETVLSPGENGLYAVQFDGESLVLTSSDAVQQYTVEYKFTCREKSPLDVPDRVVDYLNIGSQYTNKQYGKAPELSLAGEVISLGNFGGYITYYYEDALTDDPHNKYGIDFYVIGNVFGEGGESLSEPGQVYVSEDGEKWYALAGSEYYEETTLRDYQITYTKTSDGLAVWTDNMSNSIAGEPFEWPNQNVYTMNDTARESTYTFSGALIKSNLGTVCGNGSADSYAAKTSFGYVDCYSSNIVGGVVNDVNPYVENPAKSNGFDLAWAVDENGDPVDISAMSFHYVKVATATNIHAGSLGEKSTEVSLVVRTTPAEDEYEITKAPSGVTLTDTAGGKIEVSFVSEKYVYEVNVGDMKYVSLTLNGTDKQDNIYIGNTRVASGESVDGIKVTKESGERAVRIIVQNGESRPVIYMLKLIGNASESDELIEKININADGYIRSAETTDGVNYTASVGYRIDSISILPVTAPDVSYTVNGEKPEESYALKYGANTFDIEASDESGNTGVFKLSVTRQSAPETGGGDITVRFTLYGDEKHGEDKTHTYTDDKNSLPVWITQKAYTLPAGSTVFDLVERALDQAGLEYKKDGSYITEIDGLGEFENGPLSGWLYLVNGSRPEVGLSEYTLKNGDKVIMHYTDDFTSEDSNPGSGSGNSGNSGSSSSGSTDSGQTDGDGDKEDSSENNDKFPTVNKFDENTFADVGADAWYYDSVKFVYEKNLMQGTDIGFEPDTHMTRAMLVTVLYRMENILKETKQYEENGFADVDKDAWYAKAVNWAAAEGIVVGVDENHFAPDEYVTREQMTLIFHRYVRSKGYSAEVRANLDRFSDKDDISDWAKDSLAWAVEAGLIKGTSETTLSPSDSTTRAEMAAVITRLCAFAEKE